MDESLILLLDMVTNDSKEWKMRHEECADNLCKTMSIKDSPLFYYDLQTYDVF